MPPVQPPPQVLNNVVNLPRELHDPPRDQDVIETIKAVKSTRVAYGNINFILIVGHTLLIVPQKRGKLEIRTLSVWKYSVIM